jgi:hypothetical protein
MNAVNRVKVLPDWRLALLNLNFVVMWVLLLFAMG